VVERVTDTSAPAAGAAATEVGVRRWPCLASPRAGYALLAALAFVPPLLTSRGQVAADTKQYLYLDPGRLLHRAASMWDPNIGMGTVTHQNIGYLFPMGPFYWVFERLGVPDWAAQRLWLGAIVFAAATGVLYLCRTLGRTGPGVVVAALAYAFGPYSLHYAARISVILLPWAGLGWMVGFTIRALRDGGWRYPALLALTVQVVGSVNATALVFAGAAPALWVIHSTFLTREVRVRRAVATVGRTAILTLVTSLWWIAGLWIQGGYGINILKYTETVKTVARTSTPNEVLRGLGYWFFYGQDRLGPWVESARSYTQWPALILIGYGIASLALLSAAVIRWRHRTYFVLVALVGTVIAVGAHPYASPTPLGALFKAFANGSKAGLALRSTGRAIPLVVLGLAMLLGAGVDALVRWLRCRRRAALATGVGLAVGGLVLAGFPALYDGTYYGRNLQRPEEIPEYWTDAAAFLDSRGDTTRVLELPGADFAAYRWGNTVDPITPGLMDRPYVARELIPYGNEPTADLLNAFDRRIQEGVSDPGGFHDLLGLMSVGDVVLRNDIQYDRYNLVRPRALVRLFTPVPEGLSAVRTFGDVAAGSPAPDWQDEQTLAAPPNESEPPPVMVYGVAGAAPIVRAESDRRSVVVSGSGEGLVDTADVGLLAGGGAVLYSASYPDAQDLRDAVGEDSMLVVTDSNRRRGRRWSTVRDNTGYTEQAGEVPYADDPSDARLVVFPGQGEDAYTVAEQRGVRSVVATAYGNPITFTPEDRPANALDGDLDTSWKVAAFDEAIGNSIRVDLDAPITTGRINLVQILRGPRERWATEVDLRFDGGAPVHVSLGDASRSEAGQTILFDRRTFGALEITLTDTNVGRGPFHAGESPVGFAEIRMRDEPGDGGAQRPGDYVGVDEVIRMPRDLTGALGDLTSEHSLVFVMSRQRQVPVPPRSDEEPRLVRSFTVPTARTFEVTGDARLAPGAPSDVVDAVLGLPGREEGGVIATSSESLPGCVRCRAGAAIDSDPATAWNTPFSGVVGQWIDYEVERPLTFDHLALRVVADGRHSVPTRIRIEAGGRARDVDVPAVADGVGENATEKVTLRFPAMSGRHIRVTVLAVRETGTYNYFSTLPQTAPVGIAELGIPGLVLPDAPSRLPSDCRDDLLTIDGEALPVRIVGTRDDAESRGALEVRPCDPSSREAVPKLRLAAGEHVLRSAPGRETAIDIDRLVLGSDAGGGLAVSGRRMSRPPVATPSAPEVAVESRGRTSMRVRVAGASEPFWLVLGESKNAGWTARVVGGGSLGPSRLVDGYANGWRIDPVAGSAFYVEITWTPQRRVAAAIAVSTLGAVLCVAIVVATRRRRRRSRRTSRRGVPERGVARVAASGPARVESGHDAPVLTNVFGGNSTAVPARMVAVGVLSAGAGAAVVTAPWIGLLVAGMVGAALLRPRARAALALLPALLLGLAGVYIAYRQQRDHLPPVFEWPTLFPRARTLGWLAIVLLGADAVVEMVRAPRPAAGHRPGRGSTDERGDS